MTLRYRSAPLIVIVGPTASGKSTLAMAIARKYNGEIIAADSRTIYRGLDIGTAKPTIEDRTFVRHHLLDIRGPGESFGAAEFKKLALSAIDDIARRGKVPILVGGTGLYIDAVIFDYEFGAPSSKQKRVELEAKSIQELQNLCRENDIEMPINSKNRRHLIRAIELGGLKKQTKMLREHTLVVGITTKREKLRTKIEQRAREMVEKGVLEEVALVGDEYGREHEALKGNAYHIFRDVNDGNLSLEMAIDEIVKSDMALAKRQMTWFKRNRAIQWSENPDELLRAVDTFLRHYTTVVCN